MKKIAVGVSGGADSLALVLMLKEQGLAPIALTVEHGLRKSSLKEAMYVQKIMQKNNIEHHILEWKGIKPKTGIEEKAREARYQLLLEWCKKNQISDLYLAHHKNDQAETFLMRLIRGSGIDGLAAMEEKTTREGINIIRPLLSVYKQDLENYLKAKKIKWTTDKSNFNDAYLRSKIRKILPKLEKQIGLSTDRLCLCADNMQRAKDYFKCEVEKFFDQHCSNDENTIKINKDAFVSLHPEMGLRVLAKALGEVGDKVYKPRLNSLENLYNKLVAKNYKRHTLSGCEVDIKKTEIRIKPECKNKK